MKHLIQSRLSKRSEESGYVLISVITVLLVLTMMAVAILAYVFAALGLTRASIEKANKTRRIDGALETALHDVRSDPDLCANPTYAVVQENVRVTCVSQDKTTAPGRQVRVINLAAETGSTPVGWAAVKVVDLSAIFSDPDDPDADPDTADEVFTYGYSVEVCAWQLGAEQASTPLQGCS